MKNPKTKKSSPKKSEKKTSVKEKVFKFFTARALENNNSKRVIIFKVIANTKLSTKPSIISIPKELKKSGYEKEDLFIADSLGNKYEKDIPIYNPKLKGLVVKNKTSKVVSDNKNPVITELEVSLKK